MRTEKEKMLAGELYVADCPRLAVDSARASEWMDRYNAKLTMPAEERHSMLRELLASVGEGAFIRPPFHCDYGMNITLGSGVFRKRRLRPTGVQLDGLKFQGSNSSIRFAGCPAAIASSVALR